MVNETDLSRHTLPGEPASLWITTTPQTEYPALSGDISVEVAVVGGGIVGLTAATLLKDAGATVALIEANRVAGGVSGHTTAKITAAHGLIYNRLLKKQGEERALQYAEANQAAIEFISDYIQEHDVSCDFDRTFACTYALTPEETEPIQAEVSAASDLGFPVFYADELPVPFRISGAVCFENQAFLHPRKYLLHLADRIPGGGCHLFEQTRVRDVREGSPCEVITEKRTVRADRVIMATHFPILDRGLFFAKMAPRRSYLMAAKVNGPIPDGMFYHTGSPMRTFRRHATDSGGELLIIGGQHHETGHEVNTMGIYRDIEAFARRHFNLEAILYRWSTQDNFPADGVPFIGTHSMRSRRTYVATGFGGWGMTNGTAAAIILADILRDRPNPWAPVFDANRFTPFLSRKFISRNIHVARLFMQDYVTGKTDRTLSDLACGEGGIIEKDGKEVAAFKDGKGAVHLVSTACAHMGCKVAWNNAEQSWDCPCHGSRYDADGNVIHAPATTGLEPKGS